MDIKVLTNKVYHLINDAPGFPVASLVKRKNALLLELKDGTKCKLVIKKYRRFI